jgi:hypothetical protein
VPALHQTGKDADGKAVAAGGGVGDPNQAIEVGCAACMGSVVSGEGFGALGEGIGVRRAPADAAAARGGGFDRPLRA